MCRFKTGALARFAAQAGVLLAGDTLAKADLAGDVWERIGVGFQVLDDVKNLTSGNPGKQRGDDIVEGKKSLPVILFYRDNPGKFPVLADLFHLASERGMAEGRDIVEKAIALMEESGSIKMAGDIAESMMKEALKDLREIFDPGEALTLQIDMVETFLKKML